MSGERITSTKLEWWDNLELSGEAAERAACLFIKKPGDGNEAWKETTGDMNAV